MSHSETGTRAAGAWLAIASALLATAFVFHGPLQETLGEQMTVIAEGSTRWIVVHWAAAASLSLLSVTGLLVLSARSRLTESAWTMSAWAVIVIGALWTMSTAVAEATTMAGAAASGNEAIFRAWWQFAEGKASGFVVLALAVALIAGHEARGAHRTTPAWAAWIAAVAGAGSFVGWALSMWLGIRAGALLWVVSSFVMCLWLLWFGVGLARKPDRARAASYRGVSGAEAAGG